MSKPSNLGKPTVELRPSRIRRDPPASSAKPGKTDKLSWAVSSERETWIVVVGVTLFAVALTIILFGFTDYTSG